MSKQKGRGGKKQKYSIADIGGGDLTSQDLSTEKVLNFLIRGGLPEAEGREEVVEVVATAPIQDTPPSDEASLPPQDGGDASRKTGGSPPRRSLDHLFNRANKGTTLKEAAAAAKEQIVEATVEEVVAETIVSAAPPAGADFSSAKSLADTALRAEQESPVQSPLLEETVKLDPVASPAPVEAIDGTSLFQEAEAQVPPAPVKEEPLLAEESSSAPADGYEAELSRQIERWKGFYRLKDGEVSALATLFRLSHASGSPQCYVKMHKLAETSNLTYRYCQKVVRSLEQLGWIVKLRDYDASTQMGVLYQVNLKPTE